MRPAVLRIYAETEARSTCVDPCVHAKPLASDKNESMDVAVRFGNPSNPDPFYFPPSPLCKPSTSIRYCSYLPVAKCLLLQPEEPV